MNIVGAATTIAAVVAAVTKGIVSLIASIMAIVGSIIMAIYEKNKYIAIGIISMTVLSLTGALKFLILRAYSLAQKIGSKIIAAIVEAAVRAWHIAKRVYSFIKSLVGNVFSILSSFYGKLRSFLESTFAVVKRYAGRVAQFIHELLAKFRELYAKIVAGIIGKILKVVKEAASFLSTIHTIALAFDAFRQKKYLKSIYIIVTNFDEKLASEIKSVFEALDSAVSSIIRDINETFSIVEKDIGSLASFTSFMSDVLRKIGEGFGIEKIEDIAKELEHVKERLFAAARGELREIRNDVIDAIAAAFHPVAEQIRVFRLTGREAERYRRLWSYFTAEAFLPSIVTYRPNLVGVKLRR